MKFADFDSRAARDAFVAGDAAAFETAVAPLETDLSYAAVHAYLGSNDATASYALLDVIHKALINTRGIARLKLTGYRAVAWRRGAEILAAVTMKSEALPHGWPEFKVWYAEIDRNYNAILRWAKAKHARIVVTLRAAEVAPDTREQDLLRAIIADPDDDAARLVYADWLMEREDPRGPLIRAQCELRAGPLVQWDSPQRKVCDAHVAKCRPAFASELDGCDRYQIVRRGFVEVITCTPVVLAKLVKRGVFERHPVRSITGIVKTQRTLEKFAALVEQLPPSVEHISIAPDRYGRDTLDCEVGVAALAGLYARRGSLALSAMRASDWDRAYAMMRVTKLSIHACSMVPLLESLVDQAIMPELADLTFSYDAAPATLRTIGARPALRRVHFDCSPAAVAPTIDALLAESALTTIGLPLGDRIRALVSSPRAISLHAIEGKLTAEEVIAIAASPHTANVTTVDAAHDFAPIGDDATARFVAAIRASKIRRIYIDEGRMNAALPLALPEVEFAVNYQDGVYLVARNLGSETS